MRDNFWLFKERIISQEGYFPVISYLILLLLCKFYMTAFEQMIFKMLKDVAMSQMFEM